MWFTEKLIVQSNGIPKKNFCNISASSSFGKVYCFWLVDLGYMSYFVLTCSYAYISIYICTFSFSVRKYLKIQFYSLDNYIIKFIIILIV